MPITDLAASALVRRNAKLAGEIEALEARIGQRRADFVPLHAAIRITDPSLDPAAIRPERPNRLACAWVGRGKLGWLIREVPREAQMEPLTAGTVARRAWSAGGSTQATR